MLGSAARLPQVCDRAAAAHTRQRGRLGSATTDLWMLSRCFMVRLALQFPAVQGCLHIDDLSGTVKGGSHQKAAGKIQDVVHNVRLEITDVCSMHVAGRRTAIVASTAGLAKAFAADVGKGIEAGTVVRNLGTDCSLVVADQSVAAARRRHGRGPTRSVAVKGLRKPGVSGNGEEASCRAALPA